MKGKAKIEYPVIERVLEEISILDKINRQWKEGAISEFQFSSALDQLLIRLKKYHPDLKAPDLQRRQRKKTH